VRDARALPADLLPGAEVAGEVAGFEIRSLAGKKNNLKDLKNLNFKIPNFC
jgi:hypothetical protein